MSENSNHEELTVHSTEETPVKGSASEKRKNPFANIKNKGAKGKIPNWSTRNSLWTWILFGVAVILLISVYS